MSTSRTNGWILPLGWAVAWGVCIAMGCAGTTVRSTDGPGERPSVVTEVAADPAVLEGLSGIVSNDDTYYVAFGPEGGSYPSFEVFSLEVHVLEPGDPPTVVTGDELRLEVDARMPEHRHGMNTRPRVEPAGGGRFKVDGMMFHMPGRWELTFDITRRGVTERAQVDVHLD